MIFFCIIYYKNKYEKKKERKSKRKLQIHLIIIFEVIFDWQDKIWYNMIYIYIDITFHLIGNVCRKIQFSMKCKMEYDMLHLSLKLIYPK